MVYLNKIGLNNLKYINAVLDYTSRPIPNVELGEDMNLGELELLIHTRNSYFEKKVVRLTHGGRNVLRKILMRE